MVGRALLVPALSWLIVGISLGQPLGLNSRDYTRADNQAQRYAGHGLQDTRELALKLTQSLDGSEEKFRALFTWVCLNLKNDYSLYTKNKNFRESNPTPAETQTWNREFNKVVISRLLKRKSTVCTGYSYLLKDLASHVGIRCEVIDGYARTPLHHVGKVGIPNHAWIRVQLHGVWYYCDPTWASGYFAMPAKVFVHEYNPDYFLADSLIFQRNHLPLQAKPDELEAFLQGPIISVHTYRMQFHLLQPSILWFDDNTPFEILLHCPATNRARILHMEITNSRGTRIVSPQVVQRQDTLQISLPLVPAATTKIRLLADMLPVAEFRHTRERSSP